MSEINKNESTIFGASSSGTYTKKPSKRNLITFISLGAVLLLLITALVVAIILINRDNGGNVTPPKFDIWEGEDIYGNAHLAYPLIDEDKVTRIEIYNEGKEYSFIQHWDESLGKYDWRIEDYEKIDLDATDFEMLRMWLCTATTKTPIRNATDKQLATYGIDKEKYNGYKITYKSGETEKSYTVRLGEKSSSKDNVYYAYIEGRGHIYKLPADLAKYASHESYEYLSPAISAFFSSETHALLGIDRFDIYLTNGSNVDLKDVVSIRVNEKGETTVEFKAIYGTDAYGRRRTTIASTSFITTVFKTLYTALIGDRVVAVEPSEEELREFGLASEQEKYFLNVEFSDNASFASASYKNKEPSLYISRLTNGNYYVLSEYYGQRVIVELDEGTLNFLGEDMSKLIRWTDTNSIKTGFYEGITETETDPGLDKLILRTENNNEAFVLSYDKALDSLTVTAEKSGLVFKDNSEAQSSFEKNKFRNLYVYLLYFPFINSFNEMTSEETIEYIKDENIVYSITAYRNDETVVRYTYYRMSASLAIEKVETGEISGDGVKWNTPDYGNIVAMEEIRRVTTAIDKLLAGENLLPDEDILG